MAITVTHSKVSTIPDDADTSLIRPSDWNDDHVLVGLGTAAELDAGVANGVATLDSGGQVPLSQLPPLGDLNYQGTWNANTNTPTLTSSVGTKGYYYVVSVAGTTNLNGITDWQIGDWAVFNGSVWQKVDNTDAVTSVNGYTGTVVLNAADVGAVPYTGATGAVDLNAKTLVNVSNLGVNTTTVPTIKIRAVGDNNSSSRIAMRGYSSDANSSAIRVSKFRGTVAAPQAPISGDSLGKFELAGYGTTSADAYPQVSLEGVTTEVWGATARGAKAVVKVTPNTTITQVTALTIDQDSKATFANTVTANGVLLTGNTGTVTSVAALTLGTTGTDLSSTVANGTTTPVITLQVPTASATNRGALSAADWSTFNSKAPAVTYTTGYVPFGQGTTTPNQSSTFTYDGSYLYLKAADPRVVLQPSTTTNLACFQAVNAGGTALMGLDSSGAGLTAPYALNIFHFGAYPITFSTSATERMRINANAPVLCLAGGNTSATGTGIAFPATQSASSDANTLDDYEEGTYTVTRGGFVEIIGIGSITNFGKYTKIGNLVKVIITITCAGGATIAAGNGAVAYLNLPFTPSLGTSGTWCNSLSLSTAGSCYAQTNDYLYIVTGWTAASQSWTLEVSYIV